MERTLNRIAWFIGLTLIQVLLLNNICLFGYATPFIYVYFLLVIDKDVDQSVLMLMAFLLGLIVDIFSNTPGVNAGASVLLAFMRPGLLQLFSPRGEYDNFEPGIYTLVFWAFVRYIVVLIFIHHATLFILEEFSFANIEYMSLLIVCSSLLTVMLVMAIEFVRHKR